MSEQKIKVGIIGASGYTGQELLRILFRHPGVDLSFISSESLKGSKLNDLFPQFQSSLEFINLEEAKKENDLDLVFFTTPNQIAVDEAKNFLDKNISVIDFSADFRLKANDEYKKFYGFEHKDMDLLASATYGLVEYNKEKIKSLARPFLIANPGCYTTAANLALLPACKRSDLDLTSIIIDGKSGVSGAGKKLNSGLSFNEANENFKAYNIAGKHRHGPEINMLLSEASGKDIKVSFNPHLVPMFRGLQTTCYIKTQDGFSIKDFHQNYNDFYKDESFVKVLELGELPETKWTKENNQCFIGIDYDEETKTLVLCSAIDNLVKGAAGQAVQNMNLAFGFDEVLGLNSLN